MKDKPYLDTTKPLPENQSPIDGSFPEQKPKKFETLELLIHSIAPEAKRINLYKEAFTHASFSNEHRDYPSYDRLEFLGDAVLDLVVGDLSFKAHRDYNSGKLSKLRSSIVSFNPLPFSAPLNKRYTDGTQLLKIYLEYSEPNFAKQTNSSAVL